MHSTSQRRHADPPRKIQIFMHDFSTTGVVRNAIAIANRAAHEGFAVRMLVCHGSGALAHDVDPRVEAISLFEGTGDRYRRRGQLRGALFAYRRATKAWRPDVMLSAGAHGHLLSTLAWIGLPGRKVLRISNDPAKAISAPSAVKRLLRSAKSKFLLLRADRVVLVSRQQQKNLVFARLEARGRAVLIPNGVDIERMRSATAGSCDHNWMAPTQGPIVLAVGRLTHEKNLGRLVEAIAIARQVQPLRLIILGVSDPVAEQALRAQAAELGIGQMVDCVGPVGNPFPWMREATVVALPSLWEGSSNVLLEALAVGTPVVASRTAGDSWHVLDDGRYGVLVDPLDPAEIAAGLVRQCSAKAILPGDRALDFSNEGTLARYMQVFAELTDGATRGVLPASRPHLRRFRRRAEIAT
jgi:glycosyltransferase involved in cell wall biosynthesis